MSKLILDITTTILGLLYILLEVRGSWAMWIVGFVMQVLGVILYFNVGLYADCAMEFYYIAMTIYGFCIWKYGWQIQFKNNRLKFSKKTSDENQRQREITRMPKDRLIKSVIITLVLWLTIYLILKYNTNSTVPVADSFTTALSIVGIWALAQKYLEQWIVWIAVDIVSSALYFYKGIPFKASLYAIYVIIAIIGFINWKKQITQNI